MMADVNDDIEAESILRNDRFVQGVKKDRHKGFEVGTLTPRTQANPRQELNGRDSPRESVYS